MWYIILLHNVAAADDSTAWRPRTAHRAFPGLESYERGFLGLLSVTPQIWESAEPFIPDGCWHRLRILPVLLTLTLLFRSYHFVLENTS